MDEDVLHFPEVMRQLAAWKDGGPLPDPDLVLDSFIQEEVRRERLEDRLRALDHSGGTDDSLAAMKVENVRSLVEEARERVRTLYVLRGLLRRDDGEELEGALDALRDLRATAKLRREDLEDLGRSGRLGGGPP